jgi:hypothetical protein
LEGHRMHGRCNEPCAEPPAALFVGRCHGVRHRGGIRITSTSPPDEQQRKGQSDCEGPAPEQPRRE